MLVLFGLEIGYIAFTIWCLLALSMVVCVSYDRRGADAPKWWCVSIAVVIAVVYAWKTGHSVPEIFAYAASIVVPAIIYLVIGLVYSVVEFFFAVKRGAREWKKRWTSYLQEDANYQSKFLAEYNNATDPATTGYRGNITAITERYQATKDLTPVQRYSWYKHEGGGYIIDSFKDPLFEIVTTNGTPEPVINKLELSACIGVWTIFWPFYLVSLIIGDLIAEIFKSFANLIVKLSSGFVKKTFANALKD